MYQSTRVNHMKTARMPALACLVADLVSFAGAPALAQTPPLPPLPPPPAASVPLPPPTRGQLLYQTHCIACHNSQMHWRDARVVRDWAGLVEQVRHWQSRARLQWREADILEVARHLNATIYRLPQGGPVQGRAPAAGAAPRSLSFVDNLQLRG